MRLANKITVITGAGSGIGKATAVLFAQEGAKLSLADINETGQEAADGITKSGNEAFFLRTDITKPKDCERLMEETVRVFGGIDVLVNNAGIFTRGDVINTSEEVWERTITVNVGGVFNCCRYAVPYMIKAKKGNIINLGSAGGIVAIKNQMAYSVSKAAVIMMAKSMAIDLASYNIRVNVICPGSTETSMLKYIIGDNSNPDETRKIIENSRPINRIATPEEIASGILFLASDESSYATASTLVIDGGLTAW